MNDAQVIYRNFSTPLPRLRGVKRFDRTGYRAELWHEREKMPRRSGTKRIGSGGDLVSASPLSAAQKRDWCRAPHPESTAIVRGCYVRTGWEETPLGYTVIARCTGPCCGQTGGKVVRMSVYEWIADYSRGRQACQRCAVAVRKAERIARMAGMVEV